MNSTELYEVVNKIDRGAWGIGNFRLAEANAHNKSAKILAGQEPRKQEADRPILYSTHKVQWQNPSCSCWLCSDLDKRAARKK